MYIGCLDVYLRKNNHRLARPLQTSLLSVATPMLELFDVLAAHGHVDAGRARLSSQAAPATLEFTIVLSAASIHAHSSGPASIELYQADHSLPSPALAR